MIVKPSRWATRFYDAYVFDMDGTIYLGDHLLPGARSLIEELRDRDIPVRFLTNNPTNDDVVADSIGLMARRGRGVGHMLPAPAIVSYVELGGAALPREVRGGHAGGGATSGCAYLFAGGAGGGVRVGTLRLPHGTRTASTPGNGRGDGYFFALSGL